GMEPSLSVDVECTLTADFFTQMRSTMNMQRVLVNQQVLAQGDFNPPNVAPLNQVPGAVVSLMDRTNVETVMVAGKVRKWKGRLLDVDLPRLRSQLEASRDFIFAKSGVPQNLFLGT